jgi:polysaccharide pyruvyl transferase WcaK-like protein
MENKIHPGRRKFLYHSALAGGMMLLPSAILQACSGSGKKHKPTILIVSGWQDVNIGDIAHTPGLLNILQKYLPGCRLILWKTSHSEEVGRILKKNFPDVQIIYGGLNENDEVDAELILKAFDESDIMVHGSGPSVVGEKRLRAWSNTTGKPFGIFGTTIQWVDAGLKELLNKASFIYTRETASLKVLEAEDINGQRISFAPDATFYLNIHDEDKASRFLADHRLEEGKYICAIPRLRYTPYHKIKQVNWDETKIREVEETNKKYKEEDHAKLREAIVTWVRETGYKVLLCPEMTYEVDIMDDLLFNPLPDDVKPSVVKRGYWMPDEAASVYKRAFALLSFECHSPIIALANGTTAFYLRQPQDTIKGQMYYDLGFEDWVFEIEETSGTDIAGALMSVFTDPGAGKQKIDEAYKRIHSIYAASCASVEELMSANK